MRERFNRHAWKACKGSNSSGVRIPLSPPSFTFSENIKKARAKLGFTQDDLAGKADIKYTTLTKVESGVVNKPSVQTMAKIAKALGVSIEELIK